MSIYHEPDTKINPRNIQLKYYRLYPQGALSACDIYFSKKVHKVFICSLLTLEETKLAILFCFACS